MRRIGILTAGGDTPALNATVYGAVTRANQRKVEVVGPLQPAGEQPAGLWGLTITVADLDVAVAHLGPRAGAVRDAVQDGRRIVTVRAEACGGLPLALMDR